MTRDLVNWYTWKDCAFLAILCRVRLCVFGYYEGDVQCVPPHTSQRVCAVVKFLEVLLQIFSSVLYIKGNIPDSFTRLTSLIELRLSHNKLEGKSSDNVYIVCAAADLFGLAVYSGELSIQVVHLIAEMRERGNSVVLFSNGRFTLPPRWSGLNHGIKLNLSYCSLSGII